MFLTRIVPNITGLLTAVIGTSLLKGYHKRRITQPGGGNHLWRVVSG